MRKPIIKYIIFASILSITLIFGFSPKIKKSIYETNINQKKEKISSKINIIRNNLTNDNMIQFKNLYNLEDLSLINNGKIIKSGDLGNLNEDKELKPISNITKESFLEKGYWIDSETELTYYIPANNEDGIIAVKTNTKEELDHAKKVLRKIQKILMGILLIVILGIFIFYVYNFYYPFYETDKHIKKINDPLNISQYTNKLSPDNKGDFKSLIIHINELWEKLYKRLDVIDKDRNATKKLYNIMKLNNSKILSLYEFAKTLAFDIKLDKIYEKTEKILFEIMDANAFVLLLEKNNSFEVEAIKGISNYENLKQKDLVDYLKKISKSVKIRNTVEDSKFEFINMKNDDLKKLNSLIAIPIKNSNEFIGYMIVDGVFNNKLKHTDEIKTLTSIGEIVGKSLSQALKYREMNIGLNLARILYRITTLVEKEKDLYEIFREIVHSIKGIIDYTSASIYMLNDNNELEPTPEYREGEEDDILESVEFKLGRGIKALVANKKEAIIIKDVRKNQKSLKSVFNETENSIASFISVPMLINNKLIGVMNLSHKEPNKFKIEDKKILRVFANQAASTIRKVKKDKKIEDLLAKVKRESITDPLTQLYNRRYMMTSLERELDRARREGSQVGLLATDIDHFKKFNDTYGHQAGDFVLQEVAVELKNDIRMMDLACRYGGEEFFIILPNIDQNTLKKVAFRILNGIRNKTMVYENQNLSVTISIGTAISSNNIQSSKELIERADNALYKAKNTGRNKVIVYN
ncbi:MAG: sensor domain-containing diguanylate cyclase [Fusobacteriota bacterium]